jgi:hypothetical protein
MSHPASFTKCTHGVIGRQPDACGICLTEDRDRLRRELAHLVRLLEPLERAGSLAVPGLATLNGARRALTYYQTPVLASAS